MNIKKGELLEDKIELILRNTPPIGRLAPTQFCDLPSFYRN